MTTPKHTEESTDDQVSTALVEAAEPREVSLTTALHVNTRFASAAYRGGAEASVPRRISWLTGNNDCFAINGKSALPPARGWFIDQPDEEDGLLPDDYELIDAMEVLCEQGKAAPCIVMHPESSSKPRRVPSWSLPVLTLFIICQGIPSKAEMQGDQTLRWGIAYGWNPKSNRSELYFQCFIKELWEAGYAGVFTAKFSGLVTERILLCLKAQEYVLNFADALRSRSGEEQPCAYYAYGLPVACSGHTLTAGKQGQSTEVYYPIPLVPRLSVRDPESGLKYLASVAIGDSQAAILEADGRIERTVAWSIEKSRRINGGDADDQAEAPQNGDDEVPF